MCYDTVRGVTLLFGGFNGVNLRDTWAWNGASWAQVAATGPSGSFRPAMAFDSAGRVAVLQGGFDGTAYFGDTWTWNGMSWAQVAGGGPEARNDHAMAYDTTRA